MKRVLLRHAALAALTVGCLAAGSVAEAQYTYSDSYSDAYAGRTMSPENFALEIRIGGYQPDGTNGFDESFERNFGDEIGPMVGLELDFYPLRIPYVGLIGVGLGFNWAKYTGPAIGADPDADVSQEQSFRIFSLPAMAVLRVDVLARELNVPLVFVGKIGLDTIISTIDNGSVRTHTGTSFGVAWGAQVALELDFINPNRAQSLDDEWGINHTYLLFELFGSSASFGGSNLAWTFGLGMTF